MSRDQRADGPSPIAPEGVRLDEQSSSPDRAVLLAGSPRPRLTWLPDGQAEDAIVAVRAAEGTEILRETVPAHGPAGGSFVIDGPLAAYRRFVASVRFRAAGREGPASEIAFETGPFDIGEWNAQWLEVPSGARMVTPFVGVPGTARLYVTGQGIVSTAINGRPVNADRIDPARTDHARALYRAFDVGDLVRAGDNTLEIVAGLGEWHHTGLDPRVLTQLSMWGEDGRRIDIAPSSANVLLEDGVLIDEPLHRERLGRRSGAVLSIRPMPTRPTPGRSGPTAPPSRVEPDTGPAVRVVETLPTVELARGDHWRTFDVGTNIAGRAALLWEGATDIPLVTLVHGEYVDEEGRVDRTNLTHPDDAGRGRQAVEFESPSQGERLSARFAYHGFRYVEVRGLGPDMAATVTADVLHSDIPSSSRLDVDDDAVTRLLTTARRTALNNAHSVPEDCPTREQSAWTGDFASAADYLFAQFDFAAFGAKWLRDLQTSQADDGEIPAVAPDLRARRAAGEPAWGAALPRFLRAHWLHLGDPSVIHDLLPTLRAWCRHQLDRVGERGIVDGYPISYGQDWLALEQTPAELIHTVAAIHCLDTLTWLEEELGVHDHPLDARAHAQELRRAAQRCFVDSAGRVANGSQGGLAAALRARIVPDDLREATIGHLRTSIDRADGRFTTGFALTETLVAVVAEAGDSERIVAALRTPEEPGIGAMIHHGPGTFWESWWRDPHNTGTGSLDHLGLGAPFAAWAWYRLGAMEPTGGGWRTARIAPALTAGVTGARASVSTPRGRMSVAWRIDDDGQARVDIVVPPGCTAELDLPGSPRELLSGGVHSRQCRVAVRAVAPLPAGSWRPPALAWPSDDVDESGLLEKAATVALEGSSVSRDAPLRCMPVPHPQLDVCPLRVTAAQIGMPAGVRVAIVDPRRPAPGGFAYAIVDECSTGTATPTELLVRLCFSDGSSRETVGKRWPVSLNRVVVPFADGDATRELTALEVIVRRRAGGELSERPLGFHLCEIGFSARPPRW